MASSPSRYWSLMALVMVSMVGLFSGGAEAQCTCTNGTVYPYYQIPCYDLPFIDATNSNPLNLGQRVAISCQANMTDGFWDYLADSGYNCYIPHTEDGWNTGCPGRCSNLACCASYPCS